VKNLKCFAVVLWLLFGWHTAPAQNVNPARQEVLSRLKNLKPLNKKNYVYKIIVPNKTQNLPENLRLDIVYKIGHYEFKYVALRFEKLKDEDFVNVTQFVYGSALPFWKEYSKGEIYGATQGKLAVSEFNRLMNLAFILYQSNIEKEYVEPKILKTKTRGGRLSGIGSGSGVSGSSITMSSGDGRIAIRLANNQANSVPIINQTGTLHAGELKERISNGYEDLRVHLFWEVFYDYFEKNNIFAKLDNTKAEEIAISRLKESPFNKSYTDYYRQALYVKILGEIGTVNSLPILKKLTENNGLEKDWNKYLSEDALQVIEKIKLREKPKVE
jgi:hypothetical protein